MRLAAHYSLQFYLLWGNIKTDRPEVHLPVVVHTGNDEEYPGSLRSSFPQSSQSEDDGSLVFLHHLTNCLKFVKNKGLRTTLIHMQREMGMVTMMRR